MKQLLESSRYIVLLGVTGSFLAAVILFIFGLVGIIATVIETMQASQPFSDDGIKELGIYLVQSIDVFLLATVLYIISLGLYELFIDDTLKLPEWLIVHTLEDLKAKLLGVIVVILPVTFLGKLAEWKQGIDILWLGLAVGIVLVAIGINQVAGSYRKSTKR